MKKAVVIGAGQTGRGYICRFLSQLNYEISLIDNNETLVDLLKMDQMFNIHYYKKDGTPVHVKDFNVALAGSDAATKMIKDANFIFVSVGEQNLGDVAKQIHQAKIDVNTNRVIMTCENGINPKKVLQTKLNELGDYSKFSFSQTAVFCSTVNLIQTRLDILSQNVEYFPYDDTDYKDLDFPGTLKVRDFEKFLKRKIYTYNCLAGLISYMGYIYNYEIFGDAANDESISNTMDKLLLELNPALAKYFEITLEEQVEFSKLALIKFKDKSILDYTIKNGRDASRKLGPTERIMSPMRIIEEHGGDIRILQFVAACCLVYWEEQIDNGREARPEIGYIEDFVKMNGLSIDDPMVIKILEYKKEIEEHRRNVTIEEVLGC